MRSQRLVGVFLALPVLAVGGCSDPSTVAGFEPVEALVLVRVEGEEVARVGSRQLPAGTDFDLLAAVRARRGDDEVYFTEAAALEVDGRRFEGEALRPWPEGRRGRVRWFTIEGAPPYTDWRDRGRLPHFQPVFRPDWGAAWTVPGEVIPRNRNLAFGLEDLSGPSFGTARYHLRVEVYAAGSTLTPIARYASPGVLDAGASIDPAVPSVTLALEGALQSPSSVFGLPQVEGVPDGAAEGFEAMAAEGLLFSRARLLRAVLEGSAREWQDLDWTPIDLAADEGEAARWNEEVRPGDILRVGSRVVFAFRDVSEAEPAPVEEGEEGEAEIEPIQPRPGVVDYSDLCFDYSRGASVRRLGDVFAGGGEVEWGRIGQR